MRSIPVVAALAVALGVLPAASRAGAPPAPHAPATTKGAPAVHGIHAFEMKGIDGTVVPLARYQGKVLLVVNTASRCGFTPQYESLEKLRERYHAQGFEVLAFPANDFLGQEPGSDAEIQRFCATTYGTTFPLFSKIHVKGRDIAPLYKWLTTQSGYAGDIEWNFAKFLVGADGRVRARFKPNVDPLSSEVTRALDEALAARP